jgi:hypothetical protein
LKDGYPKLTLFKVFSFCKSDERLWVISGVFSSKKKKKKKSGVFSIILELSNFHNNQNIERYFSKNKNKKIEQYTIYIYIYIYTYEHKEFRRRWQSLEQHSKQRQNI